MATSKLLIACGFTAALTTVVSGLGQQGSAHPSALAPNSLQADTGADTGVETITYRRGRCMGNCPVYHFTLSPDGSGQFTGVRAVGAIGDSGFDVTPVDAAAFRNLIAAYRPKTGTHRSVAPGKPGCERAATDQASVTIEWHRGTPDAPNAVKTTLSYYLGCRVSGDRQMAKDLASAPALLPPLATKIARVQVPLLVDPPRQLSRD